MFFRLKRFVVFLKIITCLLISRPFGNVEVTEIKKWRPLPASFQSPPQVFRIPMRADILRFYDLRRELT